MTKCVAELASCLVVGLFIAATISVPGRAASDVVPPSASNSHIEANVPAAGDFDRILKRDLETHFSQQSGQDISVQFQALRKGATQSGVAYPKFYFWVIINKRTANNLLAEGAVRVAAIGGTAFEVTHFVSIKEIRKHPDIARSIFPSAVVERFSEHMK